MSSQGGAILEIPVCSNGHGSFLMIAMIIEELNPNLYSIFTLHFLPLHIEVVKWVAKGGTSIE